MLAHKQCRYRVAQALGFLLLAPAPSFAFQQPRRLAPGDVIERELRGGESHAYILPLRAGDFLRAVAEQKGVDLEATLQAPDGRVLAHSDLPNADFGPEPVVAIVESGGDYTLIIRAPSRSALGRYQLRVERIRQATAEDRKQVEAERLADEAVTLAARRTAAARAEAIEKDTRALAYFESAGDRYRQALTLNHLGLLRASSGNFRSALEAYEAAQPLFHEIPDSHGEAAALNSAGGARDVLGEVNAAMDLYQQALALYRANGESRGQAIILSNIGKLYSDMADWQRAREFYRQAVALLDPLGDQPRLALVLHNLGTAFAFTDAERGIEYYQQALTLRRSFADRGGEAETLANLGALFYQEGRLEEAVPRLEEALALQGALGNRRGEARALRTLGAAYARLGQGKRAANALDEALAKAQADQDSRGASLALLAAGLAQSLTHQAERSLESYRRAAAIAAAIGDSITLANSATGMAKAERDLGDIAGASRDAIRALEFVERVRARAGGYEERASYLSAAQESYEISIDLLMTLKSQAAALEDSERSRARSMLDMLSDSAADIRAGVDRTLLQREHEIANLLNAKGARLLPLLGRNTEQAAPLQQEIRDLERDYQQVEADIRKSSPRYAALTQPQALTVKQIQEQVLDGDSLLLEYALGEKRSFLWAVGKDSLQSWELPPRAQIEMQAQRAYELLSARSTDSALPGALRQLSDSILGPAAAALGNRRLLVVPDGGLQRLPFAALATPGSDEPLLTRHEVVMLPSASAIAVLRTEISGRKPAPKMLAVFADPVFGPDDPRAGSRAASDPPAESSRILEHLAEPGDTASARLKIPRLPFTAQEADQILSVARSPSNLKAIGFQASRGTAISGRLSEYRYLHFATHGYLDTERPSLSALVLSQIDAKGQPEDGFLRVNDIYNARLSADLVVLSACQTGLGKEVRGEGLMGLTRAFLYAGVPRVVVSLWNVNDRATAELMAALYRSMLRDGKRPSAALREAQLELRKQKRWESPYYWAAFVEHGEWQ